MKQSVLLVALFWVIFTGLASAQANEVIDSLLEEEFASYDGSVYLAMLASGQISESTSVQQAVTAYVETSRSPVSKVDPRAPVTAGEFGHILLQTTGIQTGIMYSIFPSPWFAARELQFRRFLPEAKKFNQRLTPFEVVFAIQKTLEFLESRGIETPEPVPSTRTAEPEPSPAPTQAQEPPPPSAQDLQEQEAERLRDAVNESLDDAARTGRGQGAGTEGVLGNDDVGID